MKTLKYKRILTASATVLLMAFNIHTLAQVTTLHHSTEIGIRVMPTYTTVQLHTSEGEISASNNLGYGAGAYMAVNFTDRLALQVEVIYNSFSQKYIERATEHKIKLQYVNIPVLLSINTGKSEIVNLNIAGGAQIGINVGSSISSSGYGEGVVMMPVLAVKKNDIGFAYGAGLDFALNPMRTLRIGFGYRGVMGLADISETSESITSDSYYVLQHTRINSNSGYVGLSLLF
jgi:opacity protein-like surface antigen